MTKTKTDKLNRLLGEQAKILGELQREADSLSGSSVVEENERLAASLEKETERVKELEKEADFAKKELENTKSALFRRMAQEKLSAFTSVQKRIDAMYFRADGAVESKLEAYERNSLKSLEMTRRYIEQQADGSYADIIARLEQLKQEIAARRARLEQAKETELKNAREHNNAIGAKLRDEPLTDSEKRAGLSQKSLESFIGLNILSKAGILLFLIGIILLGRYAYLHLADGFKEGLIFLLGAVLVAVGEVFHQKEKTVFSTALISGGVSVFYAAAVTGYFAFHLFSEQTVFMVCIAITAVAIALSYQVKSEVVCSFAAIGGYLPLVAIFMMGFGKVAANAMFLPVACIYFTLLAATLFVMSYNKRWNAAQYIGYGLHILSVGGVGSCAWELRNAAGFEHALLWAVVFAIISYLIYLLMPAVKLIGGKALSIGDALLLALNTVSGAVSVNITVRNFCGTELAANRAMGFVFLAFSVIYAALTVYSFRGDKKENGVADGITSVSALVFSMFIIPLLFGFEYAAVAWAAEGALLACISLKKGLRVPEMAGLGCMVLGAFAAAAIAGEYSFDNRFYTVLPAVSFGATVAAFLAYGILGVTTSAKRGEQNGLYTVCQLLSVAGAAAYLMYLYHYLRDEMTMISYMQFTDTAVSILIVLCAALVLRRGVFRNSASMLISDITGVLLLPFTVIALDSMDTYKDVITLGHQAALTGRMTVLNLVLLLIVNLGVLLFFAHTVANIVANTEAPVWVNAAALSVSSLAMITATLMNQFDVRFSSFIISGVYILAACAMLFVGFKKSYTVIRAGGLAVILAAFAKLCFVDTFHLVTGWKIVSYFAFGAVLILISYVYQRFDKKLRASAMEEAEREYIEE